MKKSIILLTIGLAITFVISFLSVVNAKAVQVNQIASSILYVAPDGNCGDASPCYETVQDAVNAANPWDEVRVAAGVYTGINNQGGQPQAIYLDKSLTLRGGYTITNWEAPDPQTNLTEINAVALGRALKIKGEDELDVTIDGIRFSNGNAAGLMGMGGRFYEETDAGGGIYISWANVELHRVEVISNTVSDGMGGGIYQYGGTLTVTDSLIQNNYAGRGAGIHVLAFDILLQDNRIEDNSTGFGEGGGINIEGGSNVDIIGNTISNNEASVGGGIISGYAIDNGLTIRENTFSGNEGGGIFLSAIYNAWIDSNLFTENKTMSVIYVGNSNVQITGNTIFSNTMQQGSAINLMGEGQVIGNIITNNTSDFGQAVGVTFNCGQYGGGPQSIFRDNTIQENVGIYNQSGGVAFYECNDMHVSGNMIVENRVTDVYLYNPGAAGSGVYLYRSDITLENNIIARNHAEPPGSSAILAIGSSSWLYHNTIDGNTGGDGAAVQASDEYYDPSVLQLHNNIITNHAIGVLADPGNSLNTVTINGVLWDGNSQNTSGRVTVLSEVSGTPDFVDPLVYDYHLTDTSAAIDQGVDVPLRIDMDGEPRFSPPDLGADEYWAPGSLYQLFMPELWKASP